MRVPALHCLGCRHLLLLLLLLAAPCSQDGLAQQFLTSLAKLKASKDCVLGLAATLSLWYLAAEDANPCYLASVAAAVLVDQLLQVGRGRSKGGSLLAQCCTCVAAPGTRWRRCWSLGAGVLHRAAAGSAQMHHFL